MRLRVPPTLVVAHVLSSRAAPQNIMFLCDPFHLFFRGNPKAFFHSFKKFLFLRLHYKIIFFERKEMDLFHHIFRDT